MSELDDKACRRTKVDKQIVYSSMPTRRPLQFPDFGLASRPCATMATQPILHLNLGASYQPKKHGDNRQELHSCRAQEPLRFGDFKMMAYFISWTGKVSFTRLSSSACICKAYIHVHQVSFVEHKAGYLAQNEGYIPFLGKG